MTNSISSNATGLAFAEETALKVLPGVAGVDAVWYGLEPNTYAEFGATISTVARLPITNTRQQAKGTTTDLDAKGGFDSDFTQRNLTRFLQGFFFEDAHEKMATNRFNSAGIVITSVDTTAGNHYNAAAGLNGFIVNHLVLAKGFGTAGNNGLKLVSAAIAAILTTTTAGEVAEAAPPAGASLEAVGYQFPAGDLVLSIVGGNVVLTSATIDPATLGINIGEWLFVGGDAAGNQFALNAAGFYGRVLSFNTAAKTITLDLCNVTPIADAGAAKSVRIFFGKYLRNSIAATDIKMRSYNLERQLGNDGGGIQSEVLTGFVPDDITIKMPIAAKATVTISGVGMDVEHRTGATGVKAGTRIATLGEEPYNTSHDVFSTKIAVIDPTTMNPTSLFGYLTDMELTIKNNVSALKALGTFGGFDANFGMFEVSGKATAYFGTVAAAQAVRNNSDVCLTAILAKKNSGFILDVPLLMLGGGLNKVEKDKPIMVDLTTTAARCAAGYTASMCFFEYLPTVALPA